MGEATIKISPNGQKIEIDAEGFTGGSCLSLLGQAMSALGGQAKIEKKPEFHEVEVETVSIGG